MQIENFTCGQISIGGTTYEHDVVIDRGEIRERKKKPSKKFKPDFGHTPLSVREKTPGSVSASSSVPAPTATSPS